MKKKKRLHLSEGGFSLVEILVTLLISSAVVAAAAGFIISGTRFYGNASAETTLQTESQMAELFITELLQESDDYKVISSTPYALEVTRGSEVAVLVFKDNALWYSTVTPKPEAEKDEEVAEVLGYGKSKTFLAEHVENFSVDPETKTDAIAADGLLKVTMKFSVQNRTYSDIVTISLRNKKKN